ncbi:MAG: rhomboid family intramembrane serine protease [Myxococcota bacterium]
MLPLRDDVPLRSAPLVVGALLAANAIVFGWCLGLAPEEATAWIERWGLVPRLFLRALTEGPPATWWTPLTAMFLHGGLLHLAGNLLYLWVFGRKIEDLLGHQRFLVFYIACGLAAALVHVASAPSAFLPTIGASGAVSGTLGAYAVSYPTGRLRLWWPPVRVPAIGFLFVWIAFQVISGVSRWGDTAAGTAWWAHVGGFVAGAALVRSMGLRRPARARLRI